MKSEITNPHDKFFKNIFSDKQIAKDFLNHYLPHDVKQLVNLETLTIVKENFVEKKLKEYFSDLLYKVEIENNPGYHYLLFEHKSYPYRLTSLQLLRYMVEIWELEIKQKDKRKAKSHKKNTSENAIPSTMETKPLPVIIPMIIYHGLNSWDIDNRFKGLFNLNKDSLGRYIPDFEYIINDLSKLSDEEIKGGVIGKVALSI